MHVHRHTHVAAQSTYSASRILDDAGFLAGCCELSLFVSDMCVLWAKLNSSFSLSPQMITMRNYLASAANTSIRLCKSIDEARKKLQATMRDRER